MRILVTGGAGYIGSHTIIELYAAGHDVLVADNLSNSSRESLRRVETITGKLVPFKKIDLCDRPAVEQLFEDAVIKGQPFDAVIHFAGLKAVGESVAKPYEYYSNNLGSTLNIINAMRLFDCRNLIFSSSATVYGKPEIIPITEDCPKGECTNPYGKTKSMIEDILIDLQKADPSWNIVLLRYFNPIGAHPSGLMGEDPNGIPNNLMPYITQVAIGKRKALGVFGNDYPTPDGTGVRDYIHVMDLASGHVKAIDALVRNCGLEIFNLGTGHGYSVMDVVKAFEKASGVKIPYTIKPRRAGDVPVCYSDPAKANEQLGWKAVRDLEQMCRDSWNWQYNNPEGYIESED